MNSKLVDLQNGQLSEVDEIKLFSKLLRTGTIWHLDSYYQMCALDLVEAGWISLDGKILANLNEIQ